MSRIPYPLAAGAVMALAVGQAVMAAAPEVNACPDVANIIQICSVEHGCTYQAAAKNGKKWTGENPMADDSDLAAVVFDSAYLLNYRTPKFASCDYVRNQGVGFRMALSIEAPATAVGNGWHAEAQRDGSNLMRCNGPVPSRCTFATPASSPQR